MGHWDGVFGQAAVIKRVMEVIVHRGPDGKGQGPGYETSVRWRLGVQRQLGLSKSRSA